MRPSVRRVLLAKNVAARFLGQEARPAGPIAVVRTTDHRAFLGLLQRDMNLRHALNRGDVVYHRNTTNVVFSSRDSKLLLRLFTVAKDNNYSAEIVGDGTHTR